MNFGSGLYVPNVQELATFARNALDHVGAIARKSKQTVVSVIAWLFDLEVVQEATIIGLKQGKPAGHIRPSDDNGAVGASCYFGDGVTKQIGDAALVGVGDRLNELKKA